MSTILGPDGEPFDPHRDLTDDDGTLDFDDDYEGDAETVHCLSVEEMKAQLTHLVNQNRDVQRDSESQRLIDRATEACLAEGEIELGLSLGTLHALRVAGLQHMVCEGLMQVAVDLKQRTQLLTRHCRVCGCTETTPCEVPSGGPCYWIEFDLCSRCG